MIAITAIEPRTPTSAERIGDSTYFSGDIYTSEHTVEQFLPTGGVRVVASSQQQQMIDSMRFVTAVYVGRRLRGWELWVGGINA
ncbi:hypothetical protein EVAR_16850_1 [Eumeta japonica]|uniref:Uncharacterized protein n=1 Tax=Eumeta variegata TaxID=151549 RepID=A0A4C1V329_EUMVA|nr:hypothetical protein EVAR_16850_1 [Eumeta japonica]